MSDIVIHKLPCGKLLKHWDLIIKKMSIPFLWLLFCVNMEPLQKFYS